MIEEGIREKGESGEGKGGKSRRCCGQGKRANGQL